jgi:hypothetical protein
MSVTPTSLLANSVNAMEYVSESVRPPKRWRRLAVDSSPNPKLRLAAALIVLTALVIVPAPLLPPHKLAEGVQSLLGVGWKGAYLISALGLHVAFYGSLGALAVLAANRAPTWRGALSQVAFVPLVIVAVVVIIRSVKLGHLPMFTNAVLPIVACMFGAFLGLGLRYLGWKVSLPLTFAMAGASLWSFLSGPSGKVTQETELCLRHLVAAGPSLPSGEARFGGLLQTAFACPPADPHATALQHNRAAILALGIAVGHERLASFAGLDAKSELVRQAISLRRETTLRGRDDWARHYTLSAALAVLENPLFSDASGLLKEQLDALTGGSGFSFADLAADRAGVRFAAAATRSETEALAMQARLRSGYVVEDFFPPVADLPEHLTVERFRQEFGGVGSQRYRKTVGEIESRMDLCAALSTSGHTR